MRQGEEGRGGEQRRAEQRRLMPGAADGVEAGGQETAELALCLLSADCRLTKHTGHVE